MADVEREPTAGPTSSKSRSQLSMRANWSRFTLLDGVILIAAFAFGMGLANDFKKTDTLSPQVHPRVDWIGTSLLWGGVIAGPFILSVQGFRGRRSAPSWGEWFWLVPSTLYLPLYAITHLVRDGFPLVVCAVAVQALFSFSASCRLVAGLFGVWPQVECRWTDLLGCSVCTAVGPAILFAVNEALSQL